MDSALVQGLVKEMSTGAYTEAAQIVYARPTSVGFSSKM
jgi:hypothetical protein